MKLLRLDRAYRVAKMRPYPENPNNGDLEAIKRALEIGQHRTVVVREPGGVVLAGNHVYMAAVELGWKTLAASVVECDDLEATEIVLEDNRVGELRHIERGALAELLDEIHRIGGLAQAGYSADQFAALRDEVGRALPADTPPPAEPQWDRPEDVAPPVLVREVVLLYGEREFTRLMELVTQLKDAYGLDSTVAVVLRAVEQAEALLPVQS